MQTYHLIQDTIVRQALEELVNEINRLKQEIKKLKQQKENAR